MKQTAVEFLETELKERYSLMNSEPIFEQARQMEREQQGYSEEEVMDMFDNFSMHLPLHYEFLVKEQFKAK